MADRQTSQRTVGMARNEEALNEGSVRGYKERSVRWKHKYGRKENVPGPSLRHV